MRLFAEAFSTVALLIACFLFCVGMQGTPETAGSVRVPLSQTGILPAASARAAFGAEAGPDLTAGLSGATSNPVALSASLRKVHVARGPSNLALMLDFSSPVNYQTEYQVRGNRLGIVLSPVDRASLGSRVQELEAAFGPAEIESESSSVHRLTVTLQDGLEPSLLSRSAAGQTRTLLLDFETSGEEQSALEPRRMPLGRLTGGVTTRLGRGLGFWRYRWTGREGSGSDVYVHRLDPTRGDFDLQLALARDRIHARRPLSEMALARQAIGGVNAGFFAINGNGDPLGLLVGTGKLLAAPIYSRSAVGLFPGGRVLFGNPELSGRVISPRGGAALDGLNQARQPGKLVLYTPEYGGNTRTSGRGLEAAIAGGRAIAIGEAGLPIPPEGFVVSVQGEVPRALRGLKVGEEVRFQYGLTPPWNSSLVAVGGGPRLVREGAAITSYESEHFSREFAMERAPRTGVGLTAGGKLLLVAVDGRRPRRSAGVTLPEMAHLMMSLGAVDALNMDGGGSTTLWSSGQVANRPSDGRERPISSALLIVPRQPTRIAAGQPVPDRG